MRTSWGPTVDVNPAPLCPMCSRPMAVYLGGYTWCTYCKYPEPPDTTKTPADIKTLLAGLLTMIVIWIFAQIAGGAGAELHAAPDYFAPTFEAMIAEAATEEAGER